MDALCTTSLLTTLDFVNSSNVNLLSLEDRLGPKRQDLYKVIPVTVIYVGIFFTGIVGNVCTCIVIARNRYMHTTTNFCLFNLAVSDLLVLILGLPQETYSFWSAYPWIFGETFCVVRTMAAETSTYASILTITAFTVERYVAICHPVKARAVAGLHRAAKIIILIWVISAVCSIPIVVQYGVVYLKDEDGVVIQGSATCNIQPDRYLAHAFEASTFLFFIAPVTVISVLYMLIGLAIRKSTMTRKGSDASTGSGRTGNDLRAQQHARARLAVIKMLVAVVVAFFICWAPFHTQRLLTIYSVPSPMTTAILFYVSGIFYYVSAVINPILYSIMSIKFRKAFRNTICSMRCGSIGRSDRSGAGGRRSAAVRTAYKFNGVRSAVAGTRGKLCPAGVGGGGGSGERHLPADGPEAPANSMDQSYSSAAGQPLSRGHLGREEQFNARVCSGGSSISKGNINICLNTTAWMGNSELKSNGCCVRLDHNGTMITPTKQDDRLCSCHRHQFRNQYYNCSSIWRNEASWTNADRIDWNCCDQLQPLKNDARDDWRRHRCGQAIWSLDRTTV